MSCRDTLSSVAAALLCVLAARGQTLGETHASLEPEDARVYEAFFRQVARSPEKSASVDVLLNGTKQTTVHQPSAQDAIGLTDAEAKMLRQSASECAGELEALERAHAASRREAFFQRIESERISPELQARLHGMEAERLRLLTDAVDRLKSGFGESRFRWLDAFIRSKRSELRFFPPTGSPTPRAR